MHTFKEWIYHISRLTYCRVSHRVNVNMMLKHAHLVIQYRKEPLSQIWESLSHAHSTMARNQIENAEIKKGVGLLIPIFLYAILQAIQMKVICIAVFVCKALSLEGRDMPSSLNASIYFASRVQNHGIKTKKEENRSFRRENLICSFGRTTTSSCLDIHVLSVEKSVWISFRQSTSWLGIKRKHTFNNISRSEEPEFAATELLHPANSETNATIDIVTKKRKVSLTSIEDLFFHPKSLHTQLSRIVVLRIHFGMISALTTSH